MTLNGEEVQVLKQLFDAMVLANGRTVTEEIQNIDTAPYVVGFKPAPGQIRLFKKDWDVFVTKLKEAVA